MKWMPSCRETSVLASRALDSRLGLTDRLALRLHLAICQNCSQFHRQIQEIRRLFSETATDADADAPGLSSQARQRIDTEVQKTLDP
jgi:hypothetical protein